ncbi:hypothetical protein BC835DRAFT_1311600 [Cytidiella melzeri]|nr:hypothetical protein BC835DRAFT_1311600 [Cytidiella melzeri]
MVLETQNTIAVKRKCCYKLVAVKENAKRSCSNAVKKFAVKRSETKAAIPTVGRDSVGVRGGIAGLIVEDDSTGLAMGVTREGVSNNNVGGASEIKLNEFALVVFSLKRRREPAVGMWGNGAIAVEGYKRTSSQNSFQANLLQRQQSSLVRVKWWTIFWKRPKVLQDALVEVMVLVE